MPTNPPSTPRRRRLIGVVVAVMLFAVGFTTVTASSASAAIDPCSTGNAIACENSKPGNPQSEWDIQGSGDDTIQGFATTMSVNPGSTVKFKIKAAATYSVDVYRLGYYGGLGARRQAPTWSVTPPVGATYGCASDAFTQNYDCGAWAVSTQWTVPSTAVSGVYIAKLTMGTGASADSSQITFVVRDDSSHSDVIFKTSDATWQAYNTYGGADFYTAPSKNSEGQARAFKVSYNRPLATRGMYNGRDFVFSNEYPTLRFLERNGVDVSYTTDLDLSTGVGTLTNHRAFMSVGHDEYWSLPERNAVTSARDAGLNLMFLSGNEAYWHTRLEPSIDGTATPNRTLVCYKDSWEPSKLDPNAEGTPTWRDPAYGAPNGSSPENSLTGTLYQSNNTDLAITVSSTEGKTRLWRGTSLANLSMGSSAVLAPHTVGYESDEDLDNGSRPAGLMDLSTTTGPTPQAIQNIAGTIVAPGTTTHHLTLYRAPSGALVFGAGTIQWGWALDQDHDGDNSNPADSRIQQATLNILADMKVLPTTVMSGLTMPSPSSDAVAPTVVVTSPQTGASLQNGASVTVAGTATDSGGGVVTTVEVSLDGGATYHRATGTTSWTYTATLPGNGGSSVKVRASDDSANLSAPVAVPITVSCPCSLFGASVPTTPSVADSSGVEVGVTFVPDADGFVSSVRFYKGAGNTGTHVGTLWTSNGTVLASGTFSNETASGWQTLTLPSAVPVTGGTRYVVSYFAPAGHYSGDNYTFSLRDYRAAPLAAPGRQSGVLNGVYNVGHGFPTSSFNDSNYYVDVLYTIDDTTPPAVTVLSPLPGSSSVATTVNPSATFAATVDPSSVTMSLVDSANASVTGSLAFDAPSRTARFIPASPLTHGASYTMSVAAKSAAGVPMPAPATWSFTVSTTDPVPGLCPCSIWNDTATPATPSAADASSVEVGVMFKADVDGQISGIRFYKGSLNVGSHTGSIWTSAGVRLATVVFSNETTTGWQTAYFTSPVNITAGATYIASYRAPNGGYALTSGGLATAVDSPPLHAPAGGGVYTYGSGAPLSATNTNYWVDVVYVATDAAPSVSSTSPASASTNVNISAGVSATLSSQILSGSAQMGVRDSAGNAVAGSVGYAAATRTVTFSPSQPLVAGVAYTATVTGAAALSGNVMSPVSWTFTTAGGTACPCSLFESGGIPAAAAIDSGDASALELGVGFSPSVTGYVTGVRFFKSTMNTGVHTGSLWDITGRRLATGTFVNETAGGWQTLTFANPVQLIAGTGYVASYYTPTGHYSATSGAFSLGYSNGPLVAASTNGLYAYGASSSFPTGSYGATNYWVDVSFTPGTLADTTPPTVTSSSPLNGSSSQPWTTGPTATFSESVASSSVVFSLSSASGPVTGTTSYDDASKTARFTPSSPLSRGTAYSATVTAKDTAGNAMAAPLVWSYTTANADPVPGQCPCSIWTDATTPAVLAAGDPAAVELGTSFTADTAGSITGVRFYKGAQNSGPHTISLWAPDQSRLATANVGSETTAGWQTAYFASPVAITAGTTYTVSYLAPNGMYSLTAGGLSTPVDNPPLHVDVNTGGYVYGGGFPVHPTSSNYWVDPVFATAAAPVPDTIPPAVSGVVVAPSGSAATITWTTDESSTSVVTYGTTAALGQSASGASATTHSVTLGGLSSGTIYYYRVGSADTSGNSTTVPTAPAAPSTFTSADTTPPVVSAVTVAPSGSTAVVTWTTDEPSTSSLAYGTTSALGQTATGASGTAHSVTITGLTSGATYSYRVTSADPSANTTTTPASPAAPLTFVAPDTVAPAVTGVAVTGSGASRTFTWTTDEASTSSVAYGTSTALGTTTTGASGTNHSVTVTGLADTTTYYYRVTSADAAGNASTSPAATASAGTFATADTTPPTVAALVATGSGMTATLTWTTNESSTSVVKYGTSATALTGTAIGATGTGHSVALSGLTVNTRYYYRVISADASGNTTTSPATTGAAASYLPVVLPVSWTTVSDFSTGSGGYLSDTSGGEIISTPTLGAEFSSGATGGTLPTPLTSVPMATGGTTTVANNVATVNGSQLSTTATSAAGTTLAVSATLSAGQRVGWGSTAPGSTGVQAVFTMNAAGALSAVIADGATVNVTKPIAGTFTGAAHEYRVDWNIASTATFFVDGVQQATNAFRPAVQLRVLLTDPVIDPSPLTVDWLRTGPYAASSTYMSSVIDAGATVGWDTLTRDIAVPSGTAVTIQVRSGSAATPGTGWTGWSTVSATSGIITRSARYLQYRVISTTSGTRFASSATKGIQIGFHVL